MVLRSSGRIKDTTSVTPLISDEKNDQYGGIFLGNTKPQSTRPQENSLRVNNIYGTDTNIELYAIDRDITK